MTTDDTLKIYEDGVAPIIVFDENNELVGVMLCKPANLPPNHVWFPFRPEVDPVAQNYVCEPDETKDGFMKLRNSPPVPPVTPDEVLKELALRQEFEAKKRQDEEAQFAEFKRTKEGKDEVSQSVQANP